MMCVLPDRKRLPIAILHTVHSNASAGRLNVGITLVSFQFLGIRSYILSTKKSLGYDLYYG